MRHDNLSISMQTLVFLTYILLITFSPSIHFINYIEFHDCQRVIQLLLLGLVLIDGLFIKGHKYHVIVIPNRVRIVFYILLILAMISAALSQEPRFAIIEISTFVALCYLAMFIARAYTENKIKVMQFFTYALWASILLYMVSFYTGYATAIITIKPLAWPHPFYGFNNIRQFQQYQLWTLGLICLPLLILDLKKVNRYFLYIGLTCWWVLLFYGASRGAILGWLAAMVITTIVYKKLAWPFLRMQIINAGAGLISYLILFKLIPNGTIITSTIFRNSVSDRTDLWLAALLMIKNHPFLGVGPMHFYFHNTVGTHPHNSLLQIASEFGLIGTLIGITLISYCCYCWIKKFNGHQLINSTTLNRNLSIILFFTIIANTAYSLVDGVIVMPISQVLMFTVIGLMVGQYIEISESIQTKNVVKTKVKFTPIIALIGLVSLLVSSMPEVIRGLSSSDRVIQPGERAFSLTPKTINPRIWTQQRREKKTEVPDAG